MSPKEPMREAQSDLAGVVLKGAGLGMIACVSGMVLRARGDGVPVDLHQIGIQGMVGILGGALIAFVLHLTRAYRAGGTIQHYSSWILASILAVFVLVIPGVPDHGWTDTVLFSLWLGFSAGLGLGLTARQLSGDRW